MTEVGKELIKQTSELVREPVQNIVNPSSKTLGERLSAIFDLLFTPVEIAQIYKNHKIEMFKNKLCEEISAIPDSKRVIPPMNIVGPAIEVAKFYIDDEELRNMFVKLVASSMNSDKTAMTHPAFIEIIKQLSPLDAINITYFKRGVSSVIADYVFKGTSRRIIPCLNIRNDRYRNWPHKYNNIW